MFGGAPSCGGQAASYGAQTEDECQHNYISITHPDNLSISIYKWFRCCGIAVCLASGAAKTNSKPTRQDKNVPPLQNQNRKGRPPGPSQRTKVAPHVGLP